MAQKRGNECEIEDSAAKRHKDGADDLDFPPHIEIFMKDARQLREGVRFDVCNLLVAREVFVNHLAEGIELQSEFHSWMGEQTIQKLQKMQNYHGQYNQFAAINEEFWTKLSAVVNVNESLMCKLEQIETAYAQILVCFSALREEFQDVESARARIENGITKVYEEFEFGEFQNYLPWWIQLVTISF